LWVKIRLFEPFQTHGMKTSGIFFKNLEGKLWKRIFLWFHKLFWILCREGKVEITKTKFDEGFSKTLITYMNFELTACVNLGFIKLRLYIKFSLKVLRSWEKFRPKHFGAKNNLQKFLLPYKYFLCAFFVKIVSSKLLNCMNGISNPLMLISIFVEFIFYKNKLNEFDRQH
jgi:hypothetical protein